MATVIVLGDGPGGLSAALFLAKNGCETHVFGKDETAMHRALLLNYLGIERMAGSDFQKVARAQVAKLGAQIHPEAITEVHSAPEGFAVTTEHGIQHSSKYLVLAGGPKMSVTSNLTLSRDTRGFIQTDRNCATSMPGVYAVGWAARPDKIQAIISAGDGAAAALDILSREKGKDLHDFDKV